MNKKESITIILMLGITAILIAVILCAIFIPLPTASEIYQDCLKSIVELRASSDNVGESFGTAEFIDKNGTLITNAHVVTYTRLGTVYQFENYSIRFSDEEDYYPVELVKYDVEIDIAVLRICESSSCKFNVIKKGKSSNLKSGDKVYAIGNTVNYGLSISQGIVGIPLLNIEYSGAVRTVIQWRCVVRFSWTFSWYYNIPNQGSLREHCLWNSVLYSNRHSYGFCGRVSYTL